MKRHTTDNASRDSSGSVTRYRRTFQNRHVVLPVIHVETQDMALRNAELAREAGADGVFLINHSTTSSRLLDIHSALTRRLNDWWIGVNCLDLDPLEVFARISRDVSGVWVDNAMIDERTDSQPEARSVLQAQMSKGFSGLYFGGVAFKYQRHVADPRSATIAAAKFMDVVTTSGPGTGQPAHVEKIRAMKEALTDSPLAIASGITPDNVAEYLPYSDCYLVATGISRSFVALDRDLLKALIDRVRSYDGQSSRQ